MLILGSHPGLRSLDAQEYYANPHNRFWRAVATITGIDARAAYAERIAGLHRSGIGLWDVLERCERRGSLDQEIVRGSEVPNDLGHVVAAHPELRAILLNGSSAAAFVHRLVLPRDLWPDAGVAIVTLPSTSPAHAAIRPADVIGTWQASLQSWCSPNAAHAVRRP